MEKTAQDQPIPHSLTSQVVGWSALARQYPIFGQTWYKYRLRSFVLPFTVLGAVLLMAVIIIGARAASDIRGALAVTWLVLFVNAVLGRSLSVWVCSQGWPARKEVVGVACALVLGVLLATFLSGWTRVYSQPEAHNERLYNSLAWLVLLTWLGGASDFMAWLRQRRLLGEARLLEQMDRLRDERNAVEQRLSMLASQVEPHFLFNTLSGVRAAIVSDPARGIVMLDHLTDYLRATIPQLRADGARLHVPLGGQLDAVQAYLGIVRARMPRLAFEVDCPGALRNAPVPPLMLISLVENAVKHGIELKSGPAHIRVTATREAGMLVLAVSDNGAGFGSAVTGSGVGLSNIRERLQHLYAGAASLSLQANADGGVCARIVLPMQEGAH